MSGYRNSARMLIWRGRLYGQRRRLATVLAVLMAAAVGYHVVFGPNGLTVYEGKRESERSLGQQLNLLSRENESLRGHVERLESDPGAIEHQAREELHYTRPGEVIVTLPVEPAAPINPQAQR